MEILSKVFLNLNINWEPLHVEKGVISKKHNLGLISSIKETNKIEELNALFDTKIHSFQLNNTWTNKYLGIKSLLKNKGLIVKYVRANMLAPYILNNFKFNAKPIFLLRHPIDVSLSFIKAFETGAKRTFI